MQQAPSPDEFSTTSATNYEGELADLRLPPHSVEAEQSVLGGLMLDNHAWDRIADILREDDFYRYEHRLIWRHISRLIELNRVADVVTVHESLVNAGQADEVGEIHYLNALTHNTPSAANIRRYAEIVRERSMLRRLVTIADDIASNALQPRGKEAREILDQAEAQIFQIAQEGARGGEGFLEIEPVLKQVVERIDELYQRQDDSEVTGVPTGFIDLDRMTSGLQEGDLVIVAGRPSMGKTSLAMNISEYIAIHHGLPVAVFSMEMGAAQLAMRMIGSVGMLDQHRLRTGKLREDDWRKVVDAMKTIQQSQIFIDETPGLSVMEVRARARRLARQCGKLGVIVIDYLQLMSGSSGSENRATEISEISRSLKGLARELNCPVVALSQLNRSLEQRPNKRPVMSDLRESGAIEQDADLILFIYRDEVYHPDTPDKGTAEIIIGKQRNGPIGTVRLAFQGTSTRFLNFIQDQ
ncbi:MAG TPA: replicative DNA helicase [Paenalcaligenes sp.]|nr:replicative DNA helicase [Paenalcaligenes sp.]